MPKGGQTGKGSPASLMRSRRPFFGGDAGEADGVVGPDEGAFALAVDAEDVDPAGGGVGVGATGEDEVVEVGEGFSPSAMSRLAALAWRTSLSG